MQPHHSLSTMQEALHWPIDLGTDCGGQGHLLRGVICRKFGKLTTLDLGAMKGGGVLGLPTRKRAQRCRNPGFPPVMRLTEV